MGRVAKPAAAAKAVKKGSHQAKKSKVWKNTTFKRPKTTTQKRTPKTPLRSVSKNYVTKLLDVVKHPLGSEAAVHNIENCNTLVFIVDKKANKKTIKQAIEQLYRLKVKKINTLITPKGNKKAYVKLTEDQQALDIANKIGIMCCLLYTSPSPRDRQKSRMPSSA